MIKSLKKAKVLRLLSCLVILALTLCTSVSSIAYAAISGTQTWTAPSDESAWFTVTNNNTTPYKTMGFSGPLWICFDFNQADSANYPPITLTVEVRNLTQGTVDITDYANGPNTSHFPHYMEVNKGDVLQFFFDVKTEQGYTPPGPYRKANIKFGYSQTYGSWF